MSILPGFRFEASRSPLYQRRTAAQILSVTHEEALAALQKDAVARRILAKGVRVQDGDKVGSRLNINVLKSTGVAVNTIHRGKNGDGYKQNRGWWSGEVISYQPVVTLRNGYLNVSQTAREKIASGAGAKEPMASVDGEYDAVDSPSFDGVELRFNPKRDHLFRDIHGYAVRCAQEVTIVGHSVFVRGEIEYYNGENVPPRAGHSPTECRLYVPEADIRNHIRL